jgi:lipopolysaccharide export system protein LptA
MRPAAIAAGPVLLACLLGPPAGAQGLNFATGDQPIEISADNGIEWQQEQLIFLARGNAVAVRGQVRVRADVLRAHYRKTPDGETSIIRLDADGHVRINTPGETAYGDHGIYDVDNAILVLSGKGVRLVTESDEITAERQLEYWEAKQMVVARGNAFAVRGDKRLGADILSAYFRNDKNGKARIYRVEAFDGVRVVTANDIATGNRGVYNVETGIATLTGSVKITREGNQLNGCVAEVNMNTNISRIFGCGTKAAGDGRVRGLLKPKKKN